MYRVRQLEKSARGRFEAVNFQREGDAEAEVYADSVVAGWDMHPQNSCDSALECGDGEDWKRVKLYKSVRPIPKP